MENGEIKAFLLFAKRVVDVEWSEHPVYQAWIASKTSHDEGIGKIGVMADGLHQGVDVELATSRDFYELKDAWWGEANLNGHPENDRIAVIKWDDDRKSYVHLREVKLQSRDSGGAWHRAWNQVKSLRTVKGAVNAVKPVCRSACALWELMSDLLLTTYVVRGSNLAAVFAHGELGGEKRDEMRYQVTKIRRGRERLQSAKDGRWRISPNEAQFDPGEDWAAFTGDRTVSRGSLDIQEAQAIADGKNRILSVQRKAAAGLFLLFLGGILEAFGIDVSILT